MQLEEYFEFLGPNDIRLKGTRVGIESVLYEYIHRAQPAETIVHRFPTLRLEQVYATILYYLENREQLDSYMMAWLEHGQHMREVQGQDPPPVVVRLRALREQKKHQEVRFTP